jgi:hypothetical protein
MLAEPGLQAARGARCASVACADGATGRRCGRATNRRVRTSAGPPPCVLPGTDGGRRPPRRPRPAQRPPPGAQRGAAPREPAANSSDASTKNSPMRQRATATCPGRARRHARARRATLPSQQQPDGQQPAEPRQRRGIRQCPDDEEQHRERPGTAAGVGPRPIRWSEIARPATNPPARASPRHHPRPAPRAPEMDTIGRGRGRAQRMEHRGGIRAGRQAAVATGPTTRRPAAAVCAHEHEQHGRQEHPGQVLEQAPTQERRLRGLVGWCAGRREVMLTMTTSMTSRWQPNTADLHRDPTAPRPRRRWRSTRRPGGASSSPRCSRGNRPTSRLVPPQAGAAPRPRPRAAGCSRSAT